MPALREILAYFKIDVDSKPLDAANKKVASFKGGLSNLTQVLNHVAGPAALNLVEEIAGAWAGASVLGHMKQFIQESIEAGKQLALTSEKIGVNIDKLEEWHLAAEEAGVGAEDLDKAFRYLNRNLGAQGKGKKEIQQAFADLGGKSTGAEDVSEFMLKLADRFESLDTQAKRTALSMSIFGKSGQSVLPLLQQGSAAVREMMEDVRELGEQEGDTAEFAKMAKESAKQAARLNFAIHGLKERFVRELLPGLIHIEKTGAKVAAQFRRLTRETDALKDALKVIGFASVYLSLERIFRLFGVNTDSVFGMIKTLLKMGPIAALAIFLGLALEDLFGLFTGKDSYIEGVIDQFYGLGAAQKMVKDFKEEWKSYLDMIDTRLPTTQAFVKGLTGSILELFKATFFAGKAVFDLGRALGSLAVDSHKDWGKKGGAFDSFKEIWKDLKGVGSGLGGSIKDITEPFIDAQASGIIPTPQAYRKNRENTVFGPPPAPIGPPAPPGINIENNFYGHADPAKVEKAAKDGVEDGMSKAARRRAFDAVGTGH